MPVIIVNLVAIARRYVALHVISSKWQGRSLIRQFQNSFCPFSTMFVRKRCSVIKIIIRYVKWINTISWYGLRMTLFKLSPPCYILWFSFYLGINWLLSEWRSAWWYCRTRSIIHITQSYFYLSIIPFWEVGHIVIKWPKLTFIISFPLNLVCMGFMASKFEFLVILLQAL